MKHKILFNLVATAALLKAGIASGVTAYDNAVLGDNPFSYWPMQETTGPTVHDVVSTNNGTMFTGDQSSLQYGAYYTSWTTNSGSAFGLGGPGFLFGVTNDASIYFTTRT